MAWEWKAKCKDCGKPYAYSDTTVAANAQRGLSRPERCPDCRRAHAREISAMGLAFYKVQRIRGKGACPATDGIRPGRLGKLSHGDREHRPHKTSSQIEEGRFPVKDRFGITEERLLEMYEQLLDPDVQALIAVGPTGSGKSTYLPYRLLVPPRADWIDPQIFTRHGQIVITQPRKQAARDIPKFVARDMRGCSLGAGFDIGFRHSEAPCCDWKSKLVYVTDGTLINWIANGDLDKISLIMIDEAHERSLNIDIIIGLLVKLLPRYPRLKLIVASATIDHRKFIEYFNNHAHGRTHCGYIGFAGKGFGVTPHFRPRDDDSIHYEAENVENLAQKAHEVLAARVLELLEAMYSPDQHVLRDHSGVEVNMWEKRGDIIGFLQASYPIHEAVRIINEKAAETLTYIDPHTQKRCPLVEAMPLYASLSQDKLDRALQKPITVQEILADEILPTVWAMLCPGQQPLTPQEFERQQASELAGHAGADQTSSDHRPSKEPREEFRWHRGNPLPPGHVLGVLYNTAQVRSAMKHLRDLLEPFAELKDHITLEALTPDDRGESPPSPASSRSAAQPEHPWPSQTEVLGRLKCPPEQGHIRVVICTEALREKALTSGTIFEASRRFGPPPDKRRVVISTNVAETSLTVHGILHVVDSGLISQSVWDVGTRTLQVKPLYHSRAGCRQRWGRAGRLTAGDAWTLYSEQEFYAPYATKEEADQFESEVMRKETDKKAANQPSDQTEARAQLGRSEEPKAEVDPHPKSIFPPFSEPEIKRAPLEQLVMTAKAAGVDQLDPSRFPWVDPPCSTELSRATSALVRIGALDSEGDLTEHGVELQRFTAEVNYANLMILADRFACAFEMAAALAMMKEDRFPKVLRTDRNWDAVTRGRVSRIHQALVAGATDDLEAMLKVFAAWYESRQGPDAVVYNDLFGEIWSKKLDALMTEETRKAIGEEGATKLVSEVRNARTLEEVKNRVAECAKAREHATCAAESPSGAAPADVEQQLEAAAKTGFSFAAWGNDAAAAFQQAASETWSRLYFVRHEVMTGKVEVDFDTMIEGLSGHKKERERRAIDFSLVDRLRVLFAQGLAQNAFIAGVDGSLRPVLPLTEQQGELKIEIAESSLFAPADAERPTPSAFVSGGRQVRVRNAPGGKKKTCLSVSSLVAVPANWVTGDSPLRSMTTMELAAFIAQTNRDRARGEQPAYLRERLFLDQDLPLGSIVRVSCGPTADHAMSDDTLTEVTVDAVQQFPQVVIEHFQSDQEEAAGSGELQDGLGADLPEPSDQGPEALADPLDPSHPQATSPFEDMAGSAFDKQEDMKELAEEANTAVSSDRLQKALTDRDALKKLAQEMGLAPAPAPEGEASSALEQRDRPLIPLARPHKGLLDRSSRPGSHAAGTLCAEVVGYEVSPGARLAVRLACASVQKAFERFQGLYNVGDEVAVRVVSRERSLAGPGSTLTVVEAETGLRVEMGPAQTSFSFHDGAVRQIPIGAAFNARVDAIETESGRVSLSTHHELIRLQRDALALGRHHRHRAQIIGTTRKDAIVMLEASAPRYGQIITVNIPLSPPDVWPQDRGTALEIHELAHRNPRHTTHWAKIPPEEQQALQSVAEGSLTIEAVGDEVKLTYHGQMTVEMRDRLLTAVSKEATRLAVQMVFERSHHLEGHIYDPAWQELLADRKVGDLCRAVIDAVDGDEIKSPWRRVRVRVDDLKGEIKPEDLPPGMEMKDLKPGDALDARLIAIDEGEKTLRLGCRQKGLLAYRNYVCRIDRVIRGKGVIVDLPVGVRGFCPAAWFSESRDPRAPLEALKAGQRVALKLIGYNEKGEPQLSRNEVLDEDLVHLTGKVVQGEVKMHLERKNGAEVRLTGALVELAPGLTKFCPYSHFSPNQVSRTNASDSLQVGQTYAFKVIADREGEGVILSRRLAIVEHVKRYVGQIFEGTIVEIKRYPPKEAKAGPGDVSGVLVELRAGIVGWCHHRRLTVGRPEDVANCIKVGQTVPVLIRRVSDDGSIDLSVQEGVLPDLVTLCSTGESSSPAVLGTAMAIADDPRFVRVKLHNLVWTRCRIGDLEPEFTASAEDFLRRNASRKGLHAFQLKKVITREAGASEQRSGRAESRRQGASSEFLNVDLYLERKSLVIGGLRKGLSYRAKFLGLAQTNMGRQKNLYDLARFELATGLCGTCHARNWPTKIWDLRKVLPEKPDNRQSIIVHVQLREIAWTEGRARIDLFYEGFPGPTHHAIQYDPDAQGKPLMLSERPLLPSEPTADTVSLSGSIGP